MSSRSYWTAVWCGFLVLTIGLGVRQSFGIFLKPVSAELQVGRELFSFGTALSMLLMGAIAPLSGRLCDRFGSAPTIAGGGVLLYALVRFGSDYAPHCPWYCSKPGFGAPTKDAPLPLQRSNLPPVLPCTNLSEGPALSST